MSGFQITSKYRDLGLPKYMQIKHSLKSAITRGTCKFGDKLPPIQDMARDYGVSYITMRQAILALEEDGHVKRIHGLGTFVADSSPESARRLMKRVKIVVPRIFGPVRLGQAYSSSPNYITEILRCISDMVQENGVEVMLASVSKNSLMDILDDETDGYYIVAPEKDLLPELEQLAHSACKFVVINASWPGQQEFVCVDSNNYESAHQAIEFVFSLGHRRIGFVSDFPLPCQITNTNDRFMGYRDAMRDLGLGSSGEELVVPTGSPKRLDESILEHLQHKDRPTALFAGGLYEAGCIYQAANRLGIKIPEQLSVIGFDDFGAAAFYQPPMTTFSQPLYEMTRMAHDCLAKKFAGEQIAGGNIFIPCALVKRDSVDYVKPCT